MDPELKILLEQLISAISTPSEFDYVTLSVSTTSALLSFCVSVLLGHVTYKLGKRQNQIAEQQTAIQKQQCQVAAFNIYKEMHRDIYRLYQQSNKVLEAIYCYFASNTAKDQAKRVEELENVFLELVDKLAIDEADFVLQKGNNEEINHAYHFACFTAYLLGIVPAYVKDNSPEQSNLDFLNANRLSFRSEKDVLNATYPYLPKDKTLLNTINKFVEEKKILFENEGNILDKIRESYKKELSE